jgi:hypothetical protein
VKHALFSKQAQVLVHFFINIARQRVILMMTMRFRRDSNIEACVHVVPGSEAAYAGGFVCMRTAGHNGDHIALARDAVEADKVCYDCRGPGESHKSDCHARR